MRIGYAGKQYPEVRNIIDKVDGQDYIFCRDLYSILLKLCSRSDFALNSTLMSNAEFTFKDFGFNSVDLIHFFNTVSFSSTPWVVTFETVEPRFKKMLDRHKYGYSNIAQDPWILKAIKAMAAPNCKALIAISQCAANMQRDALAAFPEYSDTIAKKIVVLHPPQKTFISIRTAHDKPNNKPLTVMLVGHHFFRKGGREIISALRKLREHEGASIQLILVSKIHADLYATNTTKADEIAAKNSLAENASWIRWHESLAHSQVIELMQTCDIGLLPSYSETYGYSVLEFQACGVPVITTNIRSFPEINNQEIGWIIDIPKHTDGESKHQNDDERRKISVAITKGLENILREVLNAPETIEKKGQAALQHIIDQHSPEAFAQKLLKIYTST